MSADVFRAATAYVEDVALDVTDDQLGLPTPCEAWDVRAVLLHLADVATALVGLVESGEMQMPESPVRDSPDPAAELRASLARLERSVSSSEETERVRTAWQAGAIELTAHGRDIAVAVDERHTVPDGLAGEVLALAASLIDDGARGDNFDSPVEVPDTATSSDRLAAFLGRQPSGALLDSKSM